MTIEEKDLLLKDLCARLPYGVICNVKDDKINKVYTLNGVERGGCTFQSRMALYGWNSFAIKPYLRPMSSMTEEEKREIYDWLVENDVDWFDFSKLRLDEILISFDSSWLLVNWLNTHHFDFRGLIEKNLALNCTGLHIYD